MYLYQTCGCLNTWSMFLRGAWVALMLKYCMPALQVPAAMELVSYLCYKYGHHSCVDHSTIRFWDLLQHRPTGSQRQLCGPLDNGFQLEGFLQRAHHYKVVLIPCCVLCSFWHVRGMLPVQGLQCSCRPSSCGKSHIIYRFCSVTFPVWRESKHFVYGMRKYKCAAHRVAHPSTLT